MTKSTTDVMVVGNNLAALVGALELAREGTSVCLHNPASKWGGHFGGSVFEGHQFDNGMVLLEFTSFNQQQRPDLLSYDPTIRNDCGRFTNLVGEFLGKHLELTPLPSVRMGWRGQLPGDLFISNDLECLSLLTAEESQRMKQELTAILAQGDHPLHARHKTTGEVFAQTSFETVSRKNQGDTFHDLFIEPLCKKILGVGTSEILAKYHRVAWVPLYYPNTLLDALEGRPVNLPSTEFSYPKAGYVGKVVEVLVAACEAAGVQLSHGAVTELSVSAPWEMKLQDGTTLTSNELVLAMDHGRLASWIGMSVPPGPPAASIGLAWLLVDESNLNDVPGVALMHEPSLPLYRFIHQEALAGITPEDGIHRLVLELYPEHPEVADKNEQTVLAQLAEIFHELGFLKVPKWNQGWLRWMKNALPIPGTATVAHAEVLRSSVMERMQNAHWLAPGVAFGASSFNDQIVQGLQIARRLANSKSS